MEEDGAEGLSSLKRRTLGDDMSDGCRWGPRPYRAHEKFRKRYEIGGVQRPYRNRGWKMLRLMGFADVVGLSALAFMVYKIAELGPQDAALWFGRCFHAFVAAALGYA